MNPWWNQLVKRFSRQAVDGETKRDSPKKPNLDKIVDDARKKWLQAREHFESVTDPDLIDHAIYEIVATERKYMYLLRLAREERQAIAAAESEPDQDPPTDLMEPQIQAAPIESTGQLIEQQS